VLLPMMVGAEAKKEELFQGLRCVLCHTR